MLGYLSADKYPSIFSPRMATIVFVILQIFFTTRAVLKIEEYSRIFPSFMGNIRSRDAFKPIARKQKDLMDSKYAYHRICLDFKLSKSRLLIRKNFDHQSGINVE